MIATEPLRALTEALLAEARRAGAPEADAIALRGTSTAVEVRAGQLEHAERADGVEIGLRVLLGGRQACVSASETSVDTMRGLAELAVAMAREAPVDDTLGLADPDQLAAIRDARGLQLEDEAPDPTPAALQEVALRAEAAALSRSGISQCETAHASFSRRAVWVAGSNGFSGGYGRSSHTLSTVAITGEGTGMERDWAAESRVFIEDLPTPEEIGLLAADRALSRAGATRPPTGAVPILFDARVAGGLIGHLLSAINGSAVARGASWLRDAMGEAVLPPGMDLREDPHLARYPASRPFDAEGLATASRLLVADGVLQGWTLDLSTGRRLGLPSTASATRGAGGPPSPAVSNVILTEGDMTPDALLAEMGRGLLVTSMLGASINPTTGDYSRGASGFWIEGGRISHPVNECTIAGNLRDMLLTLTAANDRPRWRSQDVPSLRVEGMTVAGA